ncbi:MAG: hypothetical protein A2Y14_02230 [Verrucomicrobia bacterium GWF2_51_19]|nr:MAG: hypothetical protein A2Y14_02230 [Verrucomicrobia bacterium GWF2_51_19]HCJ12215.1 hypothetical protein [Opitutae bacterium]
MISFIQNLLGKHHKWLFSILLVIIVISFVFTIGNTPGIGTSKRFKAGSTYFGYNLNDEKDMNRLLQQAYISFVLKTGTPPFHPMIVQQEALMRPALLSLANQLKVPTANEEQVIDYIKSCKMFQNKDGFFDQASYDKFVEDLDANKLMDKATVRTIIEENIRIRIVEKSLEMPAYTLPTEAIDFLKKLKTQWDFVQAEVKLSAFNPQITIAEDVLQKFYDDNQALYQVPERVKAKYIEFVNDAFIAKIAHPSEQELKAFYEANKKLFLPEAEDNKTLPAFEAIKDDVYSAYMKLLSSQMAEKAASELSYKLYEGKINLNSDAFNKLLADNQVAMKDLKPYSMKNIPKKSDIPQPLLQQALGLDSEHYYSDVASSDKATYILFFEAKLPEQILPFAKVRSRVLERCEKDKKQELFHQKGIELVQALQKEVDGGQSFIEAAKKAGLELVEFKQYTVESKDKKVPFPVLNALSQLEKGKISAMLDVPQGGLIVYLVQKEVPAIDAKHPEVKQAQERIGNYTSRAVTQGMISEIIQKALEKTAKQ